MQHGPTNRPIRADRLDVTIGEVRLIVAGGLATLLRADECLTLRHGEALSLAKELVERLVPGRMSYQADIILGKVRLRIGNLLVGLHKGDHHITLVEAEALAIARILVERLSGGPK